MYVGVPKIFQNEMCVRRMYRVRNSTDNNKFKMKFTYSDENENTHFPQLKRSVFFCSQKGLDFFGVYIMFSSGH